MNTSNNPTAFPVTPTDKSGQIAPTEYGMTLRDYFAAAALSLGEGVWEGKGDASFKEMAASCYRIADAMLAEREKP